MWLEMWDILHAPNARWLAYYDLHILARNFWRCSIIGLFPSSGSHKASTHFLGKSDWSKVFFNKQKQDIFLCITIFDFNTLKI